MKVHFTILSLFCLFVWIHLATHQCFASSYDENIGPYKPSSLGSYTLSTDVMRMYAKQITTQTTSFGDLNMIGTCPGLNGEVYMIFDGSGRVWKYKNGETTSVAGTSDYSPFVPNSLANVSSIETPLCCTVHPETGELYLAFTFRIVKINAQDGRYSEFIGNPPNMLSANNFVDNTLANETLITKTKSMKFGPNGDFYFMDADNNILRMYSQTTKRVTLVAGTVGKSGAASYTAVLAKNAQFNYPSDFAFDPITNDIIIADTNNNAIRRINSTSGYVTNILTGSVIKGPQFIRMTKNGDMYVGIKTMYTEIASIVKYVNYATPYQVVVGQGKTWIPFYNGIPGTQFTTEYAFFSNFAFLDEDNVNFIFSYFRDTFEYKNGKVYRIDRRWKDEYHFTLSQSDTIKSIAHVPNENSLYIATRSTSYYKLDLSTTASTPVERFMFESMLQVPYGNGVPLSEALTYYSSSLFYDSNSNRLFLGNERLLRSVDLSTKYITTLGGYYYTDAIYPTISNDYGNDGDIAQNAILVSALFLVSFPNGDILFYDVYRFRIIYANSGFIDHYAGKSDQDVCRDAVVVEGGDRLNSCLGQVTSIAIHPITNVVYFVSLIRNSVWVIRKIENDIITSIYGKQRVLCGINDVCGDGGLATDMLISCSANSASNVEIKFTSIGEMIILASEGLSGGECRIRKIGLDGRVSTIFGYVKGEPLLGVFDANYIPSNKTKCNCNTFTMDSKGVMYIVNDATILRYDPSIPISTNHIRKREFDPRVSVIFGKSAAQEYEEPFLRGVSAGGLFKTSKGDIYFSDTSNGAIRKLDIETKEIYSVVSNRNQDKNGKNQIVSIYTNTPFTNYGLRSLWVTEHGTIYFTDGNNAILKVTEEVYGEVINVAGTGSACADAKSSCGDGGLATDADLKNPSGLQVMEDGTIFFTDMGNNKIRKIFSNGTITTIAGTGGACPTPTSDCGDGKLAISATLNSPLSLFVTNNGDIYFTDTKSHKIRMIEAATGIISTIAGTGNAASSSNDGKLPTDTDLNSPTGITVAQDGTIIFSESGSHYLRFITPDRKKIFPLVGQYSSVARYTAEFTNDLDESVYSSPGALFLSGNELLFSDFGNYRVRTLTVSCPDGYLGFTCVPTCNGIIASNSSVCSKHGKCVGLNSCECNASYYGNECQVTMCNGILSNDSNVCSGHGNCIAPNTCQCKPNWVGNNCDNTYCNNILSTNPQVCNSHGTCYDKDKCDCQANYYGKYCTITSCNSILSNSTATVCSGKGVCSSYETCKCKTNYIGQYCQLTTCYGIQSNSTKACSGNGICLDYNSCKCNPNFSGSDCSITSCFGISSTKSTACSGKGLCSSYNTCQCKQGYHGNDCSVTECFGQLSNSSSVCSSKGKCLSYDNCQCNVNRFGTDCSLNKCFGLLSNLPTVCSGNGQCNDYNHCECKENHIGTSCQIPLCYSIPANDTKVCSGNGQCKNVDTCACNFPYTGETCDKYFCNGIDFDSSKVCSGQGKCISQDKCSCNVGYGGENCQHLICHGLLANDTKVCKGNGKCVGYNQCECAYNDQAFYNGTQCENLYCHSISSLDSRVCSGNGVCQSSGCKCNDNYSGDNCQIYSCNGILSTDPTVCNSHGSCTSHNTCQCKKSIADGFWDGSYCESCTPDYVFVSTGCKTPNCDPVTTCYSHGACNYTSLECICSGNWDGKYCTSCKPNYFGSECQTFCEKSISCNSKGNCNSNGTCECQNSLQTGFYSGESCEKCSTGYFGKECSTRISPPIKFLNSMNGIKFNLIGPASYSSNIVECSKLIHSSYLPKLGINPSCSWTNRGNGDFEVSFGNDFTFKPNDFIKLNRLVFDGLTDYVAYQALNADSPIAPTALIKSPNFISLCDKIILDGSGSYTGDMKPLKYIWSVVSSPNNILSTIPKSNTSLFEISSDQATLSGVYKFSLVVESSISGQQSIPFEFIVEKSSAPLPFVSIIDFPTSTFSTSSVVLIKKLITFPQCYYSDQSMTVTWKQLTGPQLDSIVDSNDNLMIRKFLTKGDQSYSFQVSVVSKVNTASTASTTVSFNTISKPLTLSLYTTKISTDSALISSTFADPEGLTGAETWSWTCLESGTGVACSSSIINALLSYSSSKTSSVTIPLTSYTSVTKPVLRISLSISKDSRKIESFVDFIVPGSGVVPPTISLISFSPQKVFILKQSDIINIDLDVSANNQKVGIDQYITRQWTLNGVTLTLSNPVLNKMLKSPSLSNSLVINPSTLTEGMTYTVELTVTDSRVSQKAKYSASFTIATTPKQCPCSITPTSAYAFDSDYVFSCSNCQNSANSLQLTFGFTDDKTMVDIALFTGTQSYKTKLPSAIDNKSTISVFFKITDSLSGAYITQKTTVKVLLPTVKSYSEVSKKVATWTNYAKSLKDGDPNKYIFNTATISRASTLMFASVSAVRSLRSVTICKNGGSMDINTGRCKCPSGFYKIDCSMNEEMFSAVHQLRLDLLESFVDNYQQRNPDEPITESYLSNQVFDLDAFVENYDEIDDYIFEKSFEIFKSLIEGSLQNENMSISSVLSNLLLNIIDSLYNYMKYSNMKTMESKVTQLEEILSIISKLVLRGTFVGEKDISFTTQFITMVINKLYASDFSSLNINNGDSSIKLPLEMPNYLTNFVDRKPVSFRISSKTITKPEFEAEIKQVYHQTQISGSLNNETIITSKKAIKTKSLTFIIDEASVVNEKNIKYIIHLDSIGNLEERIMSNSTFTLDETTSITEIIYQKSVPTCARVMVGSDNTTTILTDS